MKLSLAMIVKNEQQKLARCLESIKDYVDEIVVVDTGSTDNTKEIAKRYNAKVYDFDWCDDFSKARNFSIEKTTGDYVLALDADHVVTEFPKQKILSIIKDRELLGLAKIININTNSGEKTIHNSFQGVIFPRNAWYVRAIHEHIDPKFKREALPITIEHDGYENRENSKFLRNIRIIEKELKSNEDIYLMYKLAQEYKGLKDDENADKMFLKAYKMANSTDFFFPSLVTEYLVHLMDRCWYEQALKVIKEQQVTFNDYPEFHFTCGNFYMNLVLSDPKKYIGYFNNIKFSYERCLEIGENPKYQGIEGMGTFLPLHNLGAFYEAAGNADAAKEYYKMATEMGYDPSKQRYNALNGCASRR